jgi:hypothetical protein
VANWGVAKHFCYWVRFACTGFSPTKFGLYTALLGEVDLLTGQVLCPRSPPDALAGFAGIRVAKHEWIVQGICAYVPQVNV